MRLLCIVWCLYLSAIGSEARPVTPIKHKIACIGDSITEGFGLLNPETESYPARLQSLLGTNAIVTNYGLGGRTLVKNSSHSYWKEDFFKESHEWLPDIVIIQLGANDSRSETWSAYGEDFVSDYKEMISSYAILPNHPIIFICTPTPVYKNGAGDINPGILATNISPKVRQIAQEFNLPTIDLQVRLAGHSEWFPDTVHPDSQGMAAMAAVVCDSLSGGPPKEAPPAIRIVPLSNSTLEIGWPTQWRSLILQSVPAVGVSRPVWRLVDNGIPYADGTGIVQFVSSTGAARIFRLKQP
jgi:lysophospholipase L1-like esterase